MKTNNSQGRVFCIAIGAYLVAKAILNVVLGAGFGDVILGAVIALILFTGLQYVNYAAAAYLVLIAVVHLPDNISNFSSNWIYLIEGIADIICAVLLCAQPQIKEHFTNKWSEIQELFGK